MTAISLALSIVIFAVLVPHAIQEYPASTSPPPPGHRGFPTLQPSKAGWGPTTLQHRLHYEKDVETHRAVAPAVHAPCIR